MSQRLTYGIDDRPPLRETLLLGFQHYLTMFGSTVAIPLLLAGALGIPEGSAELGQLIGTMFFVSGITTWMQVAWGNRLPLVQGGTFSFLAPTFAICGMAALEGQSWQVRIQHVQAAVLIGSLFEILAGYTGIVGRFLRFVGPITIAPTIALIGLSLFEFGAPEAGRHWGIGGLTIALIIVFSQYLNSVHRSFQLFPILLAILLAWACAWLLTVAGVFEPGHAAHVSTANLASAPWLHVPRPFPWGVPDFGSPAVAAATIGMLAGYLASIVESVGDYYACARLAGAPTPDRRTIDRGIGMEGLGCLVAAIFGTGNGTTSYSENIGAIGLTRVGSRRVVLCGALLMIALATFGKFGALFTTIPRPIVGGMYCAMFGMIAAVGLSNLQFVDLNSGRNLFVLGFAFFMGLSVPEYFEQSPLVLGSGAPDATTGERVLDTFANLVNTIGRTGMAVGALCATVLDNTIPGTDEERGLTAMRQGATQ